MSINEREDITLKNTIDYRPSKVLSSMKIHGLNLLFIMAENIGTILITAHPNTV